MARVLLRLRRLGDRGDDIERDLLEIFHQRAATRGTRAARRRYLADVLSLWTRYRVPSHVPHRRGRSRWLADLGQDIVYAARLIRGRPAIAGLTIAGLGLAIGVGTSIFTILNAVAFRPLGVPDPASVVRVLRTSEHGMSTSWTYANYLQLRERAKRIVLEAFLMGDRIEFAEVAGADQPDRVSVRFVSGGYFTTLGGRAALGRVLAEDDGIPAAAPAVVVSHQFWVRHLRSDKSVVGRMVWLNGAAFTVAGVTERRFSDSADRAPSLWASMAARPLVLRGSAPLDRTSAAGVTVLGRLRPEVGPVQAQVELTAIAGRLGVDRAGADGTRGFGAHVVPGDGRFVGPDAGVIRTVIAIVMTAIALVLLLACANVTNLLLASATTRQREISVRLAMGASRARIVRQLLSESLALGLLAGVTGLLFTVWGVPALRVLARAPGDLDLMLDGRVWTFLTALSILAGVGAGLAPAWHGTRGDLLSPLKGDGATSGARRAPNRLRAWLVGAQAAASILLLVVAALLARSTVQASRIDVGFAADRLLSVFPNLSVRGYDTARAATYWSAALERTRTLPGVAAAALTASPPFGGSSMVSSRRLQGRRFTVYIHQTDAGYFAAIGLRVLQGRTYTADEVRTQAPVAVITESVAREYWAGENPLGSFSDRLGGDGRPRQIIGVVANALTATLNDPDGAALYLPLGASALASASLVIRARSGPELLVEPVRDALRAIDPDLRPAVSLVSTNLEGQMNQPRAMASVAGVIGAIALLLSLVGLYGVTAFAVGQRTREIGVRMAIGATTRDVARLLLKDSLRPVAIGLAAGIVLALAAARLLAGALVGVSTYDPVSLAGATAVLIATALLAVLGPTRRAARIDPARVLRHS